MLLLLLLLLPSATPRVSRENGLARRVQDYLQRIGRQDDQRISCDEDVEKLPMSIRASL